MGADDNGDSPFNSPSEDNDEEATADDDAYDTDPVPSFASPVEQREATVRFNPTFGDGCAATPNLPGTAAQTVRRVRVSAMPRFIGSNDLPSGTNDLRFAALRQFQVLTCVASATRTCANDADFTLRFTSPANAFPAERPRPRVPDVNIRSFDVPDSAATHVRIRSVSNQCSGFAGYHGEQDADPANVTDCRSDIADEEVVISEFQVLKTAAAF